ncbi:MAG TPA: SDR family oxidoreductase [Thermoleophilaceae bacterium]|nr:SDR family oxidoreductase [Thermoleophilaceae bacterium]
MELGSGTRALVTGASRGIGESLARAFAGRGCTVGLVSRSHDELKALAASLPGGSHEALTADVGDRDSVGTAIGRFGELDVLVANAGIAYYQPFQELPLERAEQMTRVNWLGTLYSIDAALPGMLERGRGHVVVVSSGAGFRAFPRASVYGATKAAQRAFSEALRHELADTGVSVTTVFPGEIRSRLHAHERDQMPDWYRSEDAGDPDELARRVVEAVERDRRALHFPAIVRLLGAAHGISPRVSDAMLRVLRGRSAAPRA